MPDTLTIAQLFSSAEAAIGKAAQPLIVAGKGTAIEGAIKALEALKPAFEDWQAAVAAMGGSTELTVEIDATDGLSDILSKALVAMAATAAAAPVGHWKHLPAYMNLLNVMSAAHTRALQLEAAMAAAAAQASA